MDMKYIVEFSDYSYFFLCSQKEEVGVQEELLVLEKNLLESPKNSPRERRIKSRLALIRASLDLSIKNEFN
jgi:hypothetical protein